jgi:hypothetical protein
VVRGLVGGRTIGLASSNAGITHACSEPIAVVRNRSWSEWGRQGGDRTRIDVYVLRAVGALPLVPETPSTVPFGAQP